MPQQNQHADVMKYNEHSNNAACQQNNAQKTNLISGQFQCSYSLILATKNTNLLNKNLTNIMNVSNMSLKNTEKTCYLQFSSASKQSTCIPDSSEVFSATFFSVLQTHKHVILQAVTYPLMYVPFYRIWVMQIIKHVIKL